MSILALVYAMIMVLLLGCPGSTTGVVNCIVVGKLASDGESSE